MEKKACRVCGELRVISADRLACQACAKRALLRVREAVQTYIHELLVRGPLPQSMVERELRGSGYGSLLFDPNVSAVCDEALVIVTEPAKPGADWPSDPLWELEKT